jgi:hypothetical protein
MAVEEPRCEDASGRDVVSAEVVKAPTCNTPMYLICKIRLATCLRDPKISMDFKIRIRIRGL